MAGNSALLRISGMVAVCLGLACTGGSDIAGTSTSSGNARTVALSGRARYENGDPSAHVPLALRPATYLPAESASVDYWASPDIKTDGQGFFRFSSVQCGEYALEINDRCGGAVLVPVSLDRTDDTVTLADAVLVPACTLSGTVTFAGGARGPVLIRFRGLERAITCDTTTGAFFVGDLPEADLNAMVTPLIPGYSSLPVAVSLTRGSAQQLAPIALSSFAGEDYSLWPYADTVYVDGTLAMAPPGEHLVDFPLPLRLDTALADFTTLLQDARDLRFSRNGRHLSFEIEHFDAVLGEVVLWLLVDTLFTDDTAQVLSVHWGNPNAQSFSSPGTVFSTARDFAGVWHLGQQGARADGSTVLSDATGSHDGIDHSTVAAAGVVDGARRFDAAASAHISLGTDPAILSGAPGITLEGWVRTSGAGHDQNILSFTIGLPSGRQSYRADLRISGSHNEATAIINPSDSASYPAVSQTAPDTIATGRWYHIAATADFGADTLMLFVNGQLAAARAFDFPVASVSGGAAASADIGARVNGSKNYFDGVIDEVRVHEVARSPAWIRMSYETMRPGSRVVRARP